MRSSPAKLMGGAGAALSQRPAGGREEEETGGRGGRGRGEGRKRRERKRRERREAVRTVHSSLWIPALSQLPARPASFSSRLVSRTRTVGVRATEDNGQRDRHARTHARTGAAAAIKRGAANETRICFCRTFWVFINCHYF